jgi:type IV fimbrial biogenesis protein FimT
MLPRRQSGVTLIEIFVGLAIIALLVGMAVPSFIAWMHNSQIRAAAESILNGMQVARAEAIRRNTRVEFRLGAGSDWSVTLPTAPDPPLQTRSKNEGSAKAVVAVQPADATAVTFAGMGWVTTNDDASPTLTQVDVTSSVLTGPEARPLRVIVSPGGSLKMCDPQVAADDPRACP